MKTREGMTNGGRSRGFTLIELTVVVAILLIFAMAIKPMVNPVLDAQRTHRFIQDLDSLPARARETAIRSGKTVTVTYDDQQKQFNFQSQDDQGNNVTNDTISVPPSVNPTKFYQGSNSVDFGDWQVNFYPDGTSDGGSIEMTRGSNDAFGIAIDQATGLCAIYTGEIPDPQNQTWQAGSYVQRTQ